MENRLITFDTAVYNERDIKQQGKEIKTDIKVLVVPTNNDENKTKSDDK